MTPNRTARLLRLLPAALALLVLPAGAQEAPAAPPAAPAEAREIPPGKTTAEVLAEAEPSDWRDLDPESTLYLTLADRPGGPGGSGGPGGRVVIELAPDFAPKHVANVKTLARQHYYDGLAVVRSQENYVVQWGDPKAGEEGAKSFGEAARSLPAEWDRPLPADPAASGESVNPAARVAIGFTPLGGPDVYAPEAGFVNGMPAVRDPENGRMGLAHCYGMVGAGRGETRDSGSGAELYVVIGHSPRHLDRNVTLLGRVVDGMEILSTLPRGTGALGFYESPEEHVPIASIRLGSELPEAERTNLQVLRTDTQTFRDLIDARRWRREEWFLDKVGAVSLCNVPLPVREKPAPPSGGDPER